jgi:hypothetical protein
LELSTSYGREATAWDFFGTGRSPLNGRKTDTLFIWMKLKKESLGRQRKSNPVSLKFMLPQVRPFTLASFMGLILLISHDECTKHPSNDYKERPFSKTGYPYR